MKLDLLLLISLIIFAFLISIVTSQTTPSEDERKLYNEAAARLNETEFALADLSEKLKDIKYNFILLMKYKDLLKTKDNVKEFFNNVTAKINSFNYNKYSMLDEIKQLNEKLLKLDNKYESTYRAYNNAESIKLVLVNMIKVFFITLIITMVVVLIAVGFISLFLFKRQRRKRHDYYEEENSREYLRPEKSKNDMEKIKIKNEQK